MTELMTVKELEHYLRFTKKTIYRLLKQRSIPAAKIGNKWRFDKVLIDRWLHQKSMEQVKARILVIDDDELVRSLFKETLEGEGHTVITAGNGLKALEYMKLWDFDLVFLDLKMPGMDGAELLKQIKSIKPKLSVTIITGYPGSEMMERALEQGPLGVMSKPFSSSDIITAVDSFLRTAQTRR